MIVRTAFRVIGLASAAEIVDPIRRLIVEPG
jgi:hypothetical protein